LNVILKEIGDKPFGRSLPGSDHLTDSYIDVKDKQQGNVKKGPRVGLFL
jgi:hypothetical protein